MRHFIRILLLLLAFAGMLVTVLAVVGGMLWTVDVADATEDLEFVLQGGSYLILLLVEGLVFGSLAGWIARQRGRTFVNWFCLGYYFSFIAVIVLVRMPAQVVIPSERRRQVTRA